MKLGIVIMVCSVGTIFASPTFSQQARLDVSYNGETLGKVLGDLRARTNCQFVFFDGVVPESNTVTLVRQDATLEEILEEILPLNGLAYSIKEDIVSITRAPQQPEVQMMTVTGRVTDERGNPLPGTSIILGGTHQGTVTGSDGRYSLRVPASNAVLSFSFIGMTTQQVAISAVATTYDVRMIPMETNIDNVIVQTGMFERDKVSFTGAVSVFTGEELKEVGNRSVLKNLSILDPSFDMLDNLEMGSNPNAMPSIEVRGQGSATINAIQDEFSVDPNQPLFILNGMEVTIEKINDLDINAVESITILKDAGSTAIYGSKGANGVIVVETVKPKAGEFRIYYNGDFSVDGPDLTVYNMMNSSEKLEFERLAGKYTYGSISGSMGAEYQSALNRLYNDRLADIARGVDTYWLSEPVRTAFSHGHSLRASGGSESLAMDVGVNYRNLQGVMKGSKRDTWGVSLGLTYRTGKLIITDNVDVSGYLGVDSPYAPFSNFVNASPYFRKRNEDGSVNKWLQEESDEYSVTYGGSTLSSITENIPNPLYNALLNSRSETKQFYISNTLRFTYSLNDAVRLMGGLDIRRSANTDTDFVAPENTRFNDVVTNKKGTYSYKEKKSMYYRGYLHAAYGQTFDRHTLGGNLRAEISQSDNMYFIATAEGFPMGSNGSPNLAHSYKEESSPDYYDGSSRSVAVIAALNYDYDRRYLFDASFRLDGASTFGSNKLYKPFWSTGIGWNINRENFAEDWTWIDLLKLSATYGTTGNQNIGKVSSTSILQSYVESNVFGLGYYLKTLGAPDLPWQVSRKFNAGFEFRGWRGRVSLKMDFYREKTDPLIINVVQIPSTGMSTYPTHVGHLIKKGFDWTLAFSPIYNLDERIFWTININGAHSVSTYGGFDSRLDALNETLLQGTTMQQYRDGRHPSDVWAVRSYGIDPTTGQEIFLKLNGEQTFIYDADDQVVVGNTRPDLKGIIGTTFRYKNISLNVAFRYSLGADIYNTALYEKVENITKSALERNQDKRALYDRWQNAGDIAKFRSITIVDDISARTSRFVQKNNYLQVESVSLSYDLINNAWLERNLGIRNLSATLYMNEVYRWETSKTERGYSYPFARTYSLGLNLSF